MDGYREVLRALGRISTKKKPRSLLVDNVSKLGYLGFSSFEKAISSVDNDHHAAFLRSCDERRCGAGSCGASIGCDYRKGGG